MKQLPEAGETKKIRQRGEREGKGMTNRTSEKDKLYCFTKRMSSDAPNEGRELFIRLLFRNRY